MLNNLAPVAIFAFNRLEHFSSTIEALSKNELAEDTLLYVFVDGPKSASDKRVVQKIIEYSEGISGFGKVFVKRREANVGLARNIIDGVSEVVDKHKRVIVMEDDLVTSKYYLSYMNQALNKYFDCSKVWHISGWSYPVGEHNDNGCFFWGGMNCWGWATWDDRWANFEKNPERLITEWGWKKRFKFNLWGANDFFCQVRGNANRKISTWAIFWYATIFENGGLCLSPKNSLVVNIGLDGSGDNCGGFNPFGERLSENLPDLPETLEVDTKLVRRIVVFYYRYKFSLFRRAWGRLMRLRCARRG